MRRCDERRQEVAFADNSELGVLRFVCAWVVIAEYLELGIFGNFGAVGFGFDVANDVEVAVFKCSSVHDVVGIDVS